MINIVWISIVLQGSSVFAQNIVENTLFHRMMNETQRTYSNEQSLLRDSATQTLTTHCGKCHDQNSESSKAAKTIFDLKDNNWWYRMTEQQLESAAFRIDALVSANAEEKERFQAFIELEKRHRQRR